MEPNKKKNVFFALALFWSIAITIACLVSIGKVPKIVTVDDADKIAHFSFYAVFSILWFLYLRYRIQNRVRLYLIVFLLAVSFGIVIEVCQSAFTEGRQADVKDAIANTIGALMGLIIMAFYNKKVKNLF